MGGYAADQFYFREANFFFGSPPQAEIFGISSPHRPIFLSKNSNSRVKKLKFSACGGPVASHSVSGAFYESIRVELIVWLAPKAPRKFWGFDFGF